MSDTITIRLEVARLIVGGCLPRNERKMRGADPQLVDAITEFKTTVTAAVQKNAVETRWK